MSNIILATSNPSKIEQIAKALSPLNATVVSMQKAGVKGEAEEDGDTLLDNALKKARYVWERTRGCVIADDTGLFIDVLHGRPGIRAARWAGANVTTDDIRDFTLMMLVDRPMMERWATFTTVAVVIAPDREEYSFEGSVRGVILPEHQAPSQPNMPYSGIFRPFNSGKVFAEMTAEEENFVSHRGRAFKKVRNYLKNVPWFKAL